MIFEDGPRIKKIMEIENCTKSQSILPALESQLPDGRVLIVIDAGTSGTFDKL